MRRMTNPSGLDAYWQPALGAWPRTECPFGRCLAPHFAAAAHHSSPPVQPSQVALLTQIVSHFRKPVLYDLQRPVQRPHQQLGQRWGGYGALVQYYWGGGVAAHGKQLSGPALLKAQPKLLSRCLSISQGCSPRVDIGCSPLAAIRGFNCPRDQRFHELQVCRSGWELQRCGVHSEGGIALLAVQVFWVDVVRS
mmetsp:Transcript_29712/g.78320  ORF Transcript_29712/g.78320 Transcript_29712/m.78320 type:complete len:194 (+) Transcript_29712:752-1333(+)